MIGFPHGRTTSTSLYKIYDNRDSPQTVLMAGLKAG